MARLDAEFSFQGSLGGLTAYRIRGIEGTFLRKRSGPSAKQIREGLGYENTRRVNREFGGRSTATKWVLNILRPHLACSDYNPAGTLNALFKPLQAMDSKSAFGERHILLSSYPQALEGFSLNRGVQFQSLVRNNIGIHLSKKEGTASIDLPSLIPGLNFFPHERYPYYSFFASLGVVPDLYHSNDGYFPSSHDYLNCFPTTGETEWAFTKRASQPQGISLQLGRLLPDNRCSLILVLSLRFGSLDSNGQVRQTRKAGATNVIGAV